MWTTNPRDYCIPDSGMDNGLGVDLYKASRLLREKRQHRPIRDVTPFFLGKRAILFLAPQFLAITNLPCDKIKFYLGAVRVEIGIPYYTDQFLDLAPALTGENEKQNKNETNLIKDMHHVTWRWHGMKYNTTKWMHSKLSSLRVTKSKLMGYYYD